MQFRSYTYDSTEIDMQYALDSRGNEIREVQLDEAFSGENGYVVPLMMQNFLNNMSQRRHEMTHLRY